MASHLPPPDFTHLREHLDNAVRELRTAALTAAKAGVPLKDKSEIELMGEEALDIAQRASTMALRFELGVAGKR